MTLARDLAALPAVPPPKPLQQMGFGEFNLRRAMAAAWDEGFAARGLQSRLRSNWRMSDTSDKKPCVFNPHEASE